MSTIIGTNGNENGVDLPVLRGTSKSDIIVGDYGDGAGIAILDIQPVPNNPIQYGDDILHGKNRDDLLIGDLLKFSFIVEASTNEGNYISNVMLTFGMDELKGGRGNDSLIGDVEEFNLTLTGGVSTSVTAIAADGFSYRDTSASTFFEESDIIFGDDELYGEVGNDYLIGDVESFNWDVLAGTATGGTATATSNTKNTLASSIAGAYADSSAILGEKKNIVISCS